MPLILGPGSPAYDFLTQVHDNFSVRRGVIVVAWARISGVGLLCKALGDTLENVDIIVGMSGRGTSLEAVVTLHSVCHHLYVFHKHPRQTFHPKIYLFDDGGTPPDNAALLVGSSNLSGSGLYQNFEGNLALDLNPSSQDRDLAIYDSVIASVRSIIDSGFCWEISTAEDINQLISERRLRRERTLVNERNSKINNESRGTPGVGRPEAPPPPLPEYELPHVDLTQYYEEYSLNVEDIPHIDAAEGDEFSADMFYVGTLTQNDINKLTGITPGTTEWDIGETARDRMPEFWGWPTEYVEVTRRISRQEWLTNGQLISNATSAEGVEVEVMLWYREERPGRAPEHRLQIRPHDILTSAVPVGFSTESLVVLERSSSGEPVFIIRFLTESDAEFDSYVRYLRFQRPQHRFGYGP